MAVTSRGRTTATDMKFSNKWKLEREVSPERTKVWTEPPAKHRPGRKAPVVYYLTRNGKLEQPHFMEVPLSSPEGLYLRDVINRFNLLRGKGMASMYSWSSKRSYKSGFVWHDLGEEDFIYPAHGNEYVLKGSELLEGSALITKSDQYSSSFKKPPSASVNSDSDCNFLNAPLRKNQSWTAADFGDYKVYKADFSGEYISRAAADASTQTDEKRHRRRAVMEIEEQKSEENCESHDRPSTEELSREEISPPPSDSSPETLEALMKSGGRVVLCPDEHQIVENQPNVRFKASSVLMQLISCGSMSFKDCGPALGKDRTSLLRIPRHAGGRNDRVRKGAMEDVAEPSFGGRVKLEDKEYFSGSFVETKKGQVPNVGALKRSNSYNADRTSHMGLMEKETERK